VSDGSCTVVLDLSLRRLRMICQNSLLTCQKLKFCFCPKFSRLGILDFSIALSV